MTGCCVHDEKSHVTITICEEQIHYPSEDYPCVCDQVLPDSAGKCLTCGHKATKHTATRICRPPSGESCDCHAIV